MLWIKHGYGYVMDNLRETYLILVWNPSMKWVGYEDMNTSVLGHFGTVLLEPEKGNLLLLRSHMIKRLHCTPQPCSVAAQNNLVMCQVLSTHHLGSKWMHSKYVGTLAEVFVFLYVAWYFCVISFIVALFYNLYIKKYCIFITVVPNFFPVHPFYLLVTFSFQDSPTKKMHSK